MIDPNNESVGIVQGNGLLKADNWPIDDITFLRTILVEHLQNKTQNAAANVINEASWGSLDGFIFSELPRDIHSDSASKLNAEAFVIGFNAMYGILAEAADPGGAVTSETNGE